MLTHSVGRGLWRTLVTAQRGKALGRRNLVFVWRSGLCRSPLSAENLRRFGNIMLGWGGLFCLAMLPVVLGFVASVERSPRSNASKESAVPKGQYQLGPPLEAMPPTAVLGNTLKRGCYFCHWDQLWFHQGHSPKVKGLAPTVAVAVFPAGTVRFRCQWLAYGLASDAWGRQTSKRPTFCR